MPGYFFDARLALVEIRSVFAGKVRTGVITEDDFRLLRRRFLADGTTGKRTLSGPGGGDV